MQLRRATMEDMYDMQNCNLRCLPENYNMRLYHYHILSWPQLLYVQQDYNHKTVGYVLGKIDDEDDVGKRHGHITSLAVLRSHRKLGIASRVMRATMQEMDTEYKAPYCSLHVRKTNDAALHLYQNTLGYRCVGVEQGYYLDGEDAYHMKCNFNGETTGMYVSEDRQLVHKPVLARNKHNHDQSGSHVSSSSGGGGAAGGGLQGVGGGSKQPAGDVGGAAAAAAKQRGKGGGGGGASGGNAAQTAKERAHAMAEMLEELGVNGGRNNKNKNNNHNTNSSNSGTNNNSKKSKKH